MPHDPNRCCDQDFGGSHYHCAHCGQVSSMIGHFYLETDRLRICPNTSPELISGRRHGFCCPPGHTCLTDTMGNDMTSKSLTVSDRVNALKLHDVIRWRGGWGDRHGRFVYAHKDQIAVIEHDEDRLWIIDDSDVVWPDGPKAEAGKIYWRPYNAGVFNGTVNGVGLADGRMWDADLSRAVEMRPNDGWMLKEIE